jgi:hypothetical protein
MARLPEQVAGKGPESWINAQQGEGLQLGLGGQQAIKGIAMGHPVAARPQAMAQLDRQQVEPLGGQLLEQGSGGGKLAQSHLGGDLPAGSRTHQHPCRVIGNGGMGCWREAIGFSQPPEQGVGVEQQSSAHRRGSSRAASSSSGSGSSSTSGGGRVMIPRNTPGLRLGVGCSRGTSRAQGRQSLATTMVSPAWAASISREKWVLASCTFTIRKGVRMATRGGCQPIKFSPLVDQVGGQARGRRPGVQLLNRLFKP